MITAHIYLSKIILFLRLYQPTLVFLHCSDLPTNLYFYENIHNQLLFLGQHLIRYIKIDYCINRYFLIYEIDLEMGYWHYNKPANNRHSGCLVSEPSLEADIGCTDQGSRH